MIQKDRNFRLYMFRAQNIIKMSENSKTVSTSELAKNV
jgi:hypothetical protein